ncbi:MAG: hypothetical protein ACE5L7_10480 [Candidatus Aminicenantales bacterium]
MKKIARVILCLCVLCIGCVQGFAGEVQSGERTKAEKLIQKMANMRYGEWQKLGPQIREIGETLLESL